MTKSKWSHVSDDTWIRPLNNGGQLLVEGSDVYAPGCDWTLSVMNPKGMVTESWPGYKTSSGAKSVATSIAKDYGLLG